MNKRFKPLVSFIRGLEPRARLVLAGIALLVATVLVATCGACRRGAGKVDPSVASPKTAPGPVSTSMSAVRAAASEAGEDPLLWSHARTGNPEGLQTLADNEGATGLVVAAQTDATLRPIALHAMAYADGWAQMPYLAEVAAGPSDDEARIALGAAIDLAARPRTSVDNEDADELAAGCSGLLALAKDAGKPKTRRISAIRALRMMPCPKAAGAEGEIPSDLDAK